MINYDYLYFREKIIDAKINNRAALFTNFIDEEYIPKWNDILTCIYNEYLQPTDEEFAKQVANGGGESVSGTVLLGKNIYINSVLDYSHESYSENRNYFPAIIDLMRNVQKHSNIALSLVGPKICIGPYQAVSHTDFWDGITLQCEGETTWVLSENQWNNDPEIDTGYIEKFVLKRGDLLFFPKGMWHYIGTSNARANLQFNMGNHSLS